MPLDEDAKARRKEQIRLSVARLRHRRRVASGRVSNNFTWRNKTIEDFTGQTQPDSIAGISCRSAYASNFLVRAAVHHMLLSWIETQPNALFQCLLGDSRQALLSVSQYYKPHHWLLSLPHRTGFPCLSLASQAFALKALASSTGPHAFKAESLKLYGKAVSLLQSLIDNNESEMVDIMAVSLLLASFELLDCNLDCVSRWRRHIHTLRPVVEIHADRIAVSNFGRALMLCWRNQLAYCGILSQTMPEADRQTKPIFQNELHHLETPTRLHVVQMQMFELCKTISFAQTRQLGCTPQAQEDLSCQHSKLLSLCTEIETAYGCFGRLLTVLPKAVAGFLV